MTATAYGHFPYHMLKADLDFDSSTVKAMLVGSGYTFDKDHEFRSSVTSEVSGTGYTAGGITLTSVATAYDATNDWATLDAADANFGTLTVTGITGMVIYISTGSSATDILVSYHSFSSQSPSAVNFTYQFNATGILKLTV